METLSLDNKVTKEYTNPDRCEAPNFVSKRATEHPFGQKIFKHLPLLTNIATALTVLGGTACVYPQTQSIDQSKNQQTQSQSYTEPKKQPTFVPVGGPESQISDETLRIKQKIDEGQILTPAETQAVLDFNATHQPVGFVTETGSTLEIPVIPSPPETFEFKSNIDQGIEVFGSENPISNEKIPQFVDFLNNKDKDIQLDSSTYYGTIFVYKDVYNQFPKDNGESLESFLLRHEQALAEIIKYSGGTKIQLTQLIILDATLGQQVDIPLIKNSDGIYVLDRIYKASDSAYWDQKNHLDWGLNHEFGHRFLKLPDLYPLDSELRNLIQTPETLTALTGIPEQWQTYFASGRKDIGDDLMSNTFDNVLHRDHSDNFFINQYIYFDLLRRIKNNNIHSKEVADEESWSYPNEVPEKSVILLYEHAEGLIGSKFEVYRTFEANTNDPNQKKGLEKIIESTVSDKYQGSITLEKDVLFPQKNKKLVESTVGTFLIKITDKSGKLYFRWMDIRDFNLAKWQQNTEIVGLKMNMTTSKDNTGSFDWTIRYMPLNP